MNFIIYNMQIKLGMVGALSLFLFMLVPVYAEVTEISIEKNFYTIEEGIVFVGTEDEGNKMISIVMIEPNGKESYLVGAMSNSEGIFETTPKNVNDFFSMIGTYQFTAFTIQKDDGVIISLEFDGSRVLQLTKSVLQLNSIKDKIVEVEKTITFTASITDNSFIDTYDGRDPVYSLENSPIDATINEMTGEFIWTPSKSYGSFEDLIYNFDIIVKANNQEDRENISIIVKKAYDEPVVEPVVEPIKSKIASFVDTTKNPQSYVDRYNNESTYKEWFDENYSQYSSIYEAVGLEEPVVGHAPEPEYIPEPTVEVADTSNCGAGTESVNGICKVIQTETTETSDGGGCLIATATYGSEMAPQVQQLRELRDNQLLQTESGTAFMSTFNDIYYSFSPIIADMEREHPLFKDAVKIAITPMISTLSLMESAESESEVLSIGISVIVLNLGMYLAVPAVVIVVIKKKF